MNEVINGEVLSAELVFSLSNDVRKLPLADDAYSEAVADVEKKLEQYVSQADKLDYSIAVASGILCGLIDAVFVGEFSLDRANEWGNEKVERFVKKIGEKTGCSGKDLASTVQNLERDWKIPADKATNFFGGGSQHHLRDFSHHPTPVGLFFSLLTQFTKRVYGTDTTGCFKNYVLSESELTFIGKNLPEKITFGVVRWFYHMVSDMAGSSYSIGHGSTGTGLPGPLVSFLKEVSALPCFKNAGEGGVNEFSVWVSKLFNGTLLGEHDAGGKIVKPLKFDLRTEIGLQHEITKMALPVVINECVVRGAYFFRRLYMEMKRAQIQSFADMRYIDWKKTVPSGNRTIQRMLTISEATFTGVDMADAAVRGAIESGGNIAVFGAKFLSRVNYVGVGRLTVSIVKEAAMDVKELEVLHEKRLLVEEMSEKHIEAIRAYRSRIEELVEQYLAEDLQAFLGGFDRMDYALANGNSDMFIRGNVTIQRVLGHEVQFETQEDFDALMESDDTFKL